MIRGAIPGPLELVIDGNLLAHWLSWGECWQLLDTAYGHDEGRYERNLQWSIRDVDSEQVWSREMPGGIWDACCETSNVLQWYLRITTPLEDEDSP